MNQAKKQIFIRSPYNNDFGSCPPSETGTFPRESNIKLIRSEDSAGKVHLKYELSTELMQLNGEISHVLQQSKIHRIYPIYAIQNRFTIPLLLGQCVIFCDPEHGPVGVSVWAWLNDELDQRLKTESIALTPDQWRCGDNLWVIEFISIPSHLKTCAYRLAQHLKSQPFKAHRTRRSSQSIDAPIEWQWWHPPADSI